MKKRIVSLGLVVAMLLGLCGQAFAVDIDTTEETTENVAEQVESVETPEEIEQIPAEIEDGPSEEDFDKGMASAEVAEQAGLLNTTGRRKARAAVSGPYAFMYENGDLVFTGNSVADTTKGEVLLDDVSGINTKAYGADLKPEWYAQARNVRRVIIETDLNPISMAYWFAGCEQLTTFVGLDKIHTENVVSLDYLFYQCYGIEEIDLSWLKTGKVTSMAHTFDSMSRLKSIDVSGFDTRNVTNMEGTFRGLAELTELNISNFVTSKVQTYDYFMYGCQKITEMDVSSLSVKGMPDYVCYDLSANTGVPGLKYEWFENLVPGAEIGNESRKNGTKQMFNGCIRLAKIHFGKDFAFRPMTGMPSQSKEYIEGADGKWFNSSRAISGSGAVDRWLYEVASSHTAYGPNNNKATHGQSEAGYFAYNIVRYKDNTAWLKENIVDVIQAGIKTSAPIFEDTVLYARAPLVVKFDPKNGENCTTIVREFGEAIGEIPSAPVKAGASFVRWGFGPIKSTDLVTRTLTVEAFYDDDNEARAVVYSDGTLVFQKGLKIHSEHGEVVDYFNDIEAESPKGVFSARELRDAAGHVIRTSWSGNYIGFPGWVAYATYRKVNDEIVPCTQTHIKTVDFVDEIHPKKINQWFMGGGYILKPNDGHSKADEAKGLGYWDGVSVLADYGGVVFKNTQNLKLDNCTEAKYTFGNNFSVYGYQYIEDTACMFRPFEYSKYFGSFKYENITNAEGIFSGANIQGGMNITADWLPNITRAESLFSCAQIGGNVKIGPGAFPKAESAESVFRKAIIKGSLTIDSGAFPLATSFRSIMSNIDVTGNLVWKNKTWTAGKKCNIMEMLLKGHIRGDIDLSGWEFERGSIYGYVQDWHGYTDDIIDYGTFAVEVDGKLDISRWNLGDSVGLYQQTFWYKDSWTSAHLEAGSVDMYGWTGTGAVYRVNELFKASRIHGDLDLSNTVFDVATSAYEMFCDATITGALRLEDNAFPKLANASKMFRRADIGSVQASLFTENSGELSISEMLYMSTGITRIDLSNVQTKNADNSSLASTTLQEIRLGPGTPKIRFPTPNPTYIKDADGYWYDSLGTKYKPDEIPEYKANVYYAITPRTVIFDPDNGTEPASFQVPYMGNAKRPNPDPVKAGKEFVGWGTEDGVLWMFSNPVTKDMTLTAKYIDRTPCTAFQYSNGEIVFQRGIEPDPTKGTVVQAVTDVENQGYTSNIWTTAPQDVTKATIQDPMMPLSTAYWFAGLEHLESIEGLDYVGTTEEGIVDPEDTLGSYLVTDTSHMFDGCSNLTYLNLGRFSTNKVHDMTGMFDNMPSLNTIVLGGSFEFKGNSLLPRNNAEGVWYTGENFDEYTPENIPSNTGETRTYTSNIETFTVSFDTGALGTQYDDQMVKFNRCASNPGKPSRTGFTFLRWVDSANTSSSPAAFDFSTPIKRDYTIKALWTPSKNVPYTQEVWVEDLETDTYTKQSTKILRGTAGATVEFDTRSVEVPEHYHINTEKSNLTGEILGDGSLALKVMMERDRHTIRFNADGGEPIESITGAKYQQSVELPTPTKQGFNFLYWTTAMGDPVKSPLVVQRDYALIAKWTALDSVTYTITSYYQNLEDDNYTLGETVTKTGQTNAMVVINSMAPDGFRLNNENSTVTGNIEGDGTAHFELYFDRILYNVTFDSNGGSEIDGALKVKYGTTLKDVETPVKDGYVFGGWETTIRTDEAGNPLKISIPIVVKDNWALRAVWNTRQTVTVETYEEIPKLPEWRLNHYQEMVGMPKISNKVILIAHKSDPEQLDKYTFQNESDFQKQTKFVLDTSKEGDWREAAKKLTRSWNGVRTYLCDDTKGQGLYEALQEVFHDLYTESAENESITYVVLPSKNEDKDIYNETLRSASMDYRTLSVIAPILYKHNLKTTGGTEPTLLEISNAIEKSMTQLCSAAADYKKVWSTTVSEPETVGLLMSTLRYSQRYESAYGLSINGEYVREPVEIKMAQPMYWEPLIATGRSGGRSDNYIKMLPVVALPPVYGYNPDSGMRLCIGISEYMPHTYIRVSTETMEIPVGQTELTLNVEDLRSLDGTKFHYNLEKSELTASNGGTIRVYKDVDKSKLTIQRRIEYSGVDLEQEQDYIEDYNKYGGRLSNSGTVTIVTSVKVDNADEFGYRNGNKDIAGELGRYGFYSRSLTKKEILARKVDDNEKLEKHGIAVSEHVWDMLESALTGYEYMHGEISASNPDVIANLVILPYVGGQLGNVDLPLYIDGTFVVDSECPGANNIMYRTYGQIRQGYSVLPLWIGSEPGDEMTTETVEHWQAKSDKFFNYESEYNPTGSVSALNYRVRVNAQDTELAELAQLLQSRAYRVNPKAFERYEFQNRFVDTEFYKQFTYEQQESLRNGRNSLAMIWNPDNTVTLGIPKARTLGEVVLEETVYVEPSYIKGVEFSLSGEEMGWGLDGYRLVQDDRYQSGVYSWIPNNVQDLWEPLLYKKTGPILTKDYGAPGVYSVRYSTNENLGFREPSAGRPDGMEFKGWTYVNEDGSLGDKVDVSEGATGRNEPYHITGLSKDMTIKAVYNAPVVKVHYDLNGADTPAEGWTLETPVGAPVVSPNVPVTREGYNLSHWSAVEKKPDGDEAYEIWQFGQLARYETYLKAEWIPTHEKTAEYSINVYKQSLDTEVYELSATVTAVGIVGSTVSPTMRAPIGFHDSTESDETGRVGIVTEDGKLKLAYYFDRNEYDVTFVNGSLQETKKYLYGSMVSKEAPTQDGKEFMGWHVVEENETDKTTGIDQDNAEYQPMPFVATGNIKLQAVWKGVTCNISWGLSDADNGLTIIESGGPNGTGLPTAIEWGQTISEPTITPVKDGWQFTGWVDENGEPVNWEKTITGQTVIKPAFEKLTYTITWDLGEADNADTVSGTGGPGGGSLVGTIGHGEVLARPIVDPTKEGKDFAGWVYATDGATWAPVTWTKPITEAVTIKPNFVEKPMAPSGGSGGSGGFSGGASEGRHWTVSFIGTDGKEITSIRVKDKEAVSMDEALENYITDNENIKWYVMEAGKTGNDLQEFKFSYRVKSNLTIRAYVFNSEKPKKPENGKWNFEKNVYDYLNMTDHIAYLVGTDDGLIKPESGITRAEVAMIMYRLLNTATFDEYYTSMNEFVDVGPEDWFNNAVSTLCNMGILKGRGNGVFDPKARITRAEFAAIISRLQPNSNKTMRDFNDVSKEHWAYKEIMTVAENGWTTAGDEEFRPDNGITRAEVTRFMNRVLRRNNVLASGLIDEAHGAKTWADNNDVMAWYYIDIQEASNSHTYDIQDGACVWTGLSGVEPMK